MNYECTTKTQAYENAKNGKQTKQFKLKVNIKFYLCISDPIHGQMNWI